MDFTTLHTLAPAINEVDGGGRPGIDHAFCLRDYAKEGDAKRLRRVAVLEEEESGRRVRADRVHVQLGERAASLRTSGVNVCV